jgi:protein-tyrosine phosphatase
MAPGRYRSDQDGGGVSAEPDSTAQDRIPLIDLHTHVLPGVDDGARNDDEALAMLRRANDDGIEVLIATPHSHHARAESVVDGVQRLNQLAAEAGIPVSVLPGHEARVSANLADRCRDGTLLTLNGGPWILFECYLFDDWPVQLIARSIDRLRDAGLRPLLAHAERYPFVQRDPGALDPLIARGIPIQVNAGSLSLRPSDPDRLTAERLLDSRMAHVIASDAHNARYRPPALSAAYERAAELAGSEYARWMRQAAAWIVAGDDLTLPR